VPFTAEWTFNAYQRNRNLSMLWFDKPMPGWYLIRFSAVAEAVTEMHEPADSVSITVTIVNELGLHARSAAKLAAVAGRAVSPVWLEREGNTVDAKSIIDILTLGCPRGETIRIIVEDPTDAHLLKDLERLVKSGFGE
jgi:phosphocarrier protein